VNYIRNRHGAVRPYVYGTPGVLRFLREVFQAVELERFESVATLQVTLRIHDGVLVLACGSNIPVNRPGTSILIYVEDIDQTYRNALDHGASAVVTPEDTGHHERRGAVQDAWGNVWWIATYDGPVS